MRSRRRSTISASAPAGSASNISGMLSAASTNATIDGEDESEVINQPAPTSCIQVPTFETMVAIQRLRKSPFCKGLHADGAARVDGRSAGFTDPEGVTGRLCEERRSWFVRTISNPRPPGHRGANRTRASAQSSLNRNTSPKRCRHWGPLGDFGQSAAFRHCRHVVHSPKLHHELIDVGSRQRTVSHPRYFSTTPGGRTCASPASCPVSASARR